MRPAAACQRASSGRSNSSSGALSTVSQALSGGGQSAAYDVHMPASAALLNAPAHYQHQHTSVTLGGSYVFIPDDLVQAGTDYAPTTMVAVTERLKRFFMLD